MSFSTLRFRLTLWNTAVVLVLLAVNLISIRTVGIVLLLIAPLGGYLLAGRATHPIAHIIHVTKSSIPRGSTSACLSAGSTMSSINWPRS
jgi:hypothetical protein